MDTYLIPKSLSDEDLKSYLPWEPVAAIWGVSKRRVSGVVNEENVNTRYFNRGGSMDYVCYLISDVLRVARQRSSKWPEKIKDIVKAEDTYPEARRKPNDKAKAKNNQAQGDGGAEALDLASREEAKKEMLKTIETMVTAQVKEQLAQTRQSHSLPAPTIKFKRSHKILVVTLLGALTAGIAYGGLTLHKDTMAQLKSEKLQIINALTNQNETAHSAHIKAIGDLKSSHQRSMAEVMNTVKEGITAAKIEIKKEIQNTQISAPFWAPFRLETNKSPEE